MESGLPLCKEGHVASDAGGTYSILSSKSSEKAGCRIKIQVNHTKEKNLKLLGFFPFFILNRGSEVLGVWVDF